VKKKICIFFITHKKRNIAPQRPVCGGGGGGGGDSLSFAASDFQYHLVQ